MRNRRLYYSAVFASRLSNDIHPHSDTTLLGEPVSGLIDTSVTVKGVAADFARKIIKDGR